MLTPWAQRCFTPSLPFTHRFIVPRQRRRLPAPRTPRVHRPPLSRMGLRPQVPQHVVPGPPLALRPQRRHVHRRHHDLLARPGVGLGQYPPVVIHHHAAARPRERRVVVRRRRLVRRHDVGYVFQRPTTVHHRPPVHRRRRAPRVHVRRHPHQHLRTAQRQLADRLGKEPVVTDRRPDLADLGINHREHLVRVARQVVRAGVDLPRYPRVHLAVAGKQAVWADQARRVEHMAGEPRITLQEAAGLDERPVVAAEAVVAVGVLVGDRHGQLVVQFLGRLVDRGGVGELGEDDQPHVPERPVADHRPRRPSSACARRWPRSRSGASGSAGRSDRRRRGYEGWACGTKCRPARGDDLLDRVGRDGLR